MKSDLAAAGITGLDWVSEAELFLSDHQQEIEVEAISGKITVKTLKQYAEASE